MLWFTVGVLLEWIWGFFLHLGGTAGVVAMVAISFGVGHHSGYRRANDVRDGKEPAPEWAADGYHRNWTGWSIALLLLMLYISWRTW